MNVGIIVFILYAVYRVYQKIKEASEEAKAKQQQDPDYGQYTPKPKPHNNPTPAKPHRPGSIEEMLDELIEKAEASKQKSEQRYEPTKPIQAEKKPERDVMGRPVSSIEYDSEPLDVAPDVTAPKNYEFSDSLAGSTLKIDPNKTILKGRVVTAGNHKPKLKINPRQAVLYKELLDRKYFEV